MAGRKDSILDLPILAAGDIADGDYIPIVDIDGSSSGGPITKRISLTALATALATEAVAIKNVATSGEYKVTNIRLDSDLKILITYEEDPVS